MQGVKFNFPRAQIDNGTRALPHHFPALYFMCDKDALNFEIIAIVGFV